MAEPLDTTERLEEAEEQVATGLPWTSILLLLVAAGFAWGLSFALPDPGKPPIIRADTLENWWIFAERILADVLRAAGLLALALVVAVVVPGAGLALERLVLGSRRGRFLAVTAILATLSSALFAYFVLEHMPHIQDEVAMEFQARVLASGRLYAPAPELPDFFSYEFIVMDSPRWYGKYFFGPSLLLVPGVWLGATWLINPILAAAAVLLTFAIGRHLFGEKIARVAAVLMVISPFRLSVFAIMMAHPACMVALGIYALGVIKVVRDPGRARWALIAGIGIGFAANCRPLTALAIGAAVVIPALWVFDWCRLRWQVVVAFVLPVAFFALAAVGYNYALTGDPLVSPFQKWSPKDRLGFGDDVGLEYWRTSDRGHSFHKALYHNTYFNLEALGPNLTGWGFVTLLLLVWPVVRSRWPGRTRAVAAVAIALALAYFFYLTPSVFAGQARYWSEALPAMIILVAIALASLRVGLGQICRVLGLLPAARTGRSACWLAGVFLTLYGIHAAYVPLWDECRKQYWGQGAALREAVAEASLSNALVLVDTPHFRDFGDSGAIDLFGSAFPLNDVDLAGPIVYARDLGAERNSELIARYPDRSVYRVNLAQGLVPSLVRVDRSR